MTKMVTTPSRPWLTYGRTTHGKELVTTLPNAWELEALWKSWSRRASTKREVLDMLMELCRRNPRAAAPQNPLAVDPHKLDVLISTGLTAQQAIDILAVKSIPKIQFGSSIA
ncbi:hypothetical protein [Nitrospira sp. Nam74]